MNKLIKELLEQSGVKFVTLPSDSHYAKFAELIIRECADVADDLDLDVLQVGTAIREHFGIEQ